MTNALTFQKIQALVESSPEWARMISTVEDSMWHREANVAVHTLMTIAEAEKVCDALGVSDRIRFMAQVALLFHDFGKPEAEEVLDRKDGSGRYRRYAGHEPKSANEFISFYCKSDELKQLLAAAGLSFDDVRKIKFMIEQHLPYGLKNPQKVADLRRAVISTLGADEAAFYVMLIADTRGRISDDHQEKINAVYEWIDWFQAQQPAKQASFDEGKVLHLVVGVSGAGKSTLIRKMFEDDPSIIVLSLDQLRERVYQSTLTEAQLLELYKLTPQEQYEEAIKYCFGPGSKDFDRVYKDLYHQLIEDGRSVIIDATNQTRKFRRQWTSLARQHRYKIKSHELYISEELAVQRQSTRGDKSLSAARVHDMIMRMEVPWLGVEVDEYSAFVHTK